MDLFQIKFVGPDGWWHYELVEGDISLLERQLDMISQDIEIVEVSPVVH